MKSLKVLAALAIAAATFSACGNSTPKANLKTDVDSLSYAIGLAQSQYVRQAIQQGQVIDTTYMDEFVKGINEGANAGDDKKRAAYIMGLQIGQQIATQLVKGVNHEVYGNDTTKTISLKNLLAGFVTGATGKKGLMTPEMANQVAQTKMEIIKSKTMMKEGHGAIPTDTTTVTVNYEGRTIDGKIFESSYTNGQGPVTIQPKQFIPGWTQALTRMPAGSVWEVYIPQSLAYGAREAGQIKPFSTLIFKIELIKVGGK